MLHTIEGHLLSGYADGGDAPDKELELVPGAVSDATAFLQEMPEALTRFDRVSDLVTGFESAFGLELLATVHWVASNEGAVGDEQVIERTYEWGDRKRQFSERQIVLALRTLEAKGWLDACSSE